MQLFSRGMLAYLTLSNKAFWKFATGSWNLLKLSTVTAGHFKPIFNEESDNSDPNPKIGISFAVLLWRAPEGNIILNSLKNMKKTAEKNTQHTFFRRGFLHYVHRKEELCPANCSILCIKIWGALSLHVAGTASAHFLCLIFCNCCW